MTILKILEDARDTAENDKYDGKDLKKPIKRALKVRTPGVRNSGPSGDYTSRDNYDQGAACKTLNDSARCETSMVSTRCGA